LFWNKIEDAIARPFSKVAQTECRARSRLLQKALVDFGADASFAAAVEKIKKHYEVDVASSTTRLGQDVNTLTRFLNELRTER
jgi:hypothetical protein